MNIISNIIKIFNTKSIQKSLIVVCFFTICTHIQVQAQRCNLAVAADCGSITAQGGLANGSDYIFCDSSTVFFNNTSTGAPDSTYYCWGDGKDTAVLGIGFASHRYILPANVTCSKSYTIRMTVVKRCAGGTFRSSHYIETPIIVKKKPRGTFTITANGCTGTSMSITNQSTCPPTSFKWLFGDGTADSTNWNPVHTYTSPGNYTLTLISSGCLGVGDTAKRFVTIYNPPIAKVSSASSSSTSGCGPLTLTFNNTTTNASTYKWSVVTGPTGYTFATGSTSTSTNPTMVFTDTGTYRVRLVATSLYCGTSSWDTVFRVLSAPVVNLVGISDGCNSLTVRPSQLVTYTKGVPTTYSWTFTGVTPNTSSARLPADITYPIGNYSISVLASNVCGSSSSTINFKVTPPPTGGFVGTLSPSNNCIPADVQLQANTNNVTAYDWQVISTGGFSYQGGTTRNSANPQLRLTSVGSYQIKMTAIGCSAITKDTTFTLITRPTPTLDSIGNACLPYTVNPGAIVHYTDGVATSYNWTFAGASRPTDNVRNPSFVTYDDPGLYSIEVGATNVCGTGRDTISFRVDSLPEVSATLLPDKNIYCAPATITFNNDLKYVYKHQWRVNGVGRYRFLNGTTVTSPNPVIEFLDEGNYTVQLTGDGCVSDTWTQTIQVLAPPSVSLDSVGTSCQTLTVDPTAIAHFTGGTPSSYLWTFTGRTPDSSKVKNPSPLIYTPGTYSIIARAINACAVATDTVRFTVVPAPVIGAVALFGNPNGCVPVDIDLQSNTRNASSYRWSVVNSTAFAFVNNTNANSENAVLRFNNQGSYQLRLNVVGCSAAQWDTTITLIAPPSVSLDSVPNGCQTLTVNPSAIVRFSGGNPTSYLWTFTGLTPDSSNIRSPSALTYSPGSYSIIARALNACAVATDTVRFTVVPSPKIGAVALLGNPNGCVPIDIDVQSRTQNAQSYTWSILNSTAFSFVNNTNANTENAVLRFTNQGSYQIRLNVVGCSPAQWDTTITLLTSPSLSLDSLPLTCAPFTAFPSSLVRYSGGTPTSYDWSFVGGTPATSTQRAPSSVVFNNIGVNKITVKASNVCGSAFDTTKFNLNGGPKANILTSLSDTNKCSPVEMTINSSQSLFVDSYRWTAAGAGFINNTQPNSPNPVFRFSSAGSYAIHLDADGCGTTTWDTTITVIIPPSVILTKILDTCGQLIVNPASIITYNGGTPNKYTWTFNNTPTPTSSLRLPPPITYDRPGNYSIITRAENQCGVSSDTVKFAIKIKPIIEITPLPLLCNTAAATQLQATPVGGFWSGSSVSFNGFFDPATAPLGINKLLYRYGSGQCANTDSLSIEVGGAVVQAGDDISICQNEKPQILKGASPQFGIWTGIGIVDSINGVFDPLNVPLGVHTVTYTLKNNRTGCINKSTREIRVNPAPRAAFDSLRVGCIGSEITFQNRSVGIDNAVWDFGDNTSTNLLSPTHTYDSVKQYRVWLRVNTVNGCKDSTSRLVEISKQGTPAFIPDRYSGCGPLLPITFTNRAVGQNLKYLWDFGTGQRDSSANPPTILFKQSNYDTSYIIKLTVSNTCGATSVSDTIWVRPRPTANFGIRPRNDCSPMIVDFSNASLGYPTSFYWDFGNGRTSRDSALYAQTYRTDTLTRNYDITLIVGNVCGSDTLTQHLKVLPPNVKAFFSIESLSSCAPFTVKCANYSTVGSHVWWDSGNGTTSFSTTTFEHTYNTPGFYTITLYAANPNGCGFDSIQRRIEVLPPAEVGFIHAPSVCIGDTLTLRDTSRGFIFRIWHFGDNDSSRLLNAVHVYKNSGNFTINMLGNTINGNCAVTRSSQVFVRPLPKADLLPNKTDGCPPLKVSFQNRSSTDAAYAAWDFGDRNTTNIISPTHIYDSSGNYTVKLRVTDNYGCSDDTIFNRIVVHDVPKAKFEAQPDRLCGIPVRVQFNNRTVGAVGYEWKLGNSLTSVSTHPTTSYGAENTYPIQLIATNSFFCKDTFNSTFRTYNQPNADFTLTPQKGCMPLTVRFQDASTYAVGKRYWLFGDGTTDSLLNPTHIYEQAGNFTPKLVVSNGAVCFDTLELTKAVTVLQNPVADFTARDSVSSRPNGIIVFTNQSDYAQSYVWDFNDGSGKVTHVHPIHRYRKTGQFQVAMIAKAANGCTDTIIKPVDPKFFSGLFVPNAFSPENGADAIRLFSPQGLMLKTYKLAIYSTYGDVIWQTDKLEDGKPVESWDGTKNGKPLPQDVYVWKIQATFEDGSIWLGMPDGKGRYYTTGTLTLLR